MAFPRIRILADGEDGGRITEDRRRNTDQGLWTVDRGLGLRTQVLRSLLFKLGLVCDLPFFPRGHRSANVP